MEDEEEETRTCPKCGSTMKGDRHLQSLGSETELVTKDGFLGDQVKAFYCVKCGYIELYRGRKRWEDSAVSSSER
jgi:predicted nucleic-acid-binding Zn-ribbon protein